MTPWFIATGRFDQSDEGWGKYIAWSGLEQLDEVVSLDGSLCPTVLPNTKAEYWNHIVNEDFMLHFFVDLDYLRKETADVHRKNLLCVFRNPSGHPSSQVPKGFEFIGYDLVDKDSSVSALMNCGGFPKAFSNGELSEKGLFRTHERSEKFRAPYVSNTPTNITQIAIYGLSSAGSNCAVTMYDLDVTRPMGSWRKACLEACKRTGVRYRWHDLRHSFVTRLAERPDVSESAFQIRSKLDPILSCSAFLASRKISNLTCVFSIPLNIPIPSAGTVFLATLCCFLSLQCRGMIHSR